tara:strand:+ start:145 stop:594 length:450 start_codon:yes stop_codon:yes gene_type:complete
MPQFTSKGYAGLSEKIQQQAEALGKKELEDYFTLIADDAVDMSPIWSGAYVKSFSFRANNTTSRGRGIDGRNWRFPKKTGTEADRETGRSQLMGDIKQVVKTTDPFTTKSYTLRNDAGHARFVENGGNERGPKPRNGYKIFARLRSKYG